MGITIRPAVASDAEACGRIIFDAFKDIADRHAFPRDFPSVEIATQLAHAFIASPFRVRRRRRARRPGGRIELSRGRRSDPRRRADHRRSERAGPRRRPAADGGGGRARARCRRHPAGGQDAFNTRSMALYASLGFDVMEPLLLVSGRPRSGPVAGVEVRPLADADMGACEALCRKVHGITRNGEVRDAGKLFRPLVVTRNGRLTGYLTAPTFWIMNHGVAETDEDMTALIARRRRHQPGSGVVPAADAVEETVPLVPERGPARGQADDADGARPVPGAAGLLFPVGFLLSRRGTQPGAG